MEGNASVGTGFVEGDVGDKVGCKGTGVEKDQLGVVEDKGNGGRGRGKEFRRWWEFGRRGEVWLVVDI